MKVIVRSRSYRYEFIKAVEKALEEMLEGKDDYLGNEDFVLVMELIKEK